MFVYLFICLAVRVSMLNVYNKKMPSRSLYCLSVYLSIYLCIYLAPNSTLIYFYLSTQSISIYLSSYQSIYLLSIKSIYLPVYLLLCLFFLISLSIFLYLPTLLCANINQCLVESLYLHFCCCCYCSRDYK